MRTGLVVHLKVTALIMLDTAVQNVTAIVIRKKASSDSYYNITGTADQLHMLEAKARDWEPNISKVWSLQNAYMLVYYRLGIEAYPDMWVQSGDLSHIVFIKSSAGLVLIYTARIDEMSLEVSGG